MCPAKPINPSLTRPAAVAKAAHLHVDQRVRVVVEVGRVIITPEAPAALILAQRLALYDPARHGGEIMDAPFIGAEKWYKNRPLRAGYPNDKTSSGSIATRNWGRR